MPKSFMVKFKRRKTIKQISESLRKKLDTVHDDNVETLDKIAEGIRFFKIYIFYLKRKGLFSIKIIIYFCNFWIIRIRSLLYILSIIYSISVCIFFYRYHFIHTDPSICNKVNLLWHFCTFLDLLKPLYIPFSNYRTN